MKRSQQGGGDHTGPEPDSGVRAWGPLHQAKALLDFARVDSMSGEGVTVGVPIAASATGTKGKAAAEGGTDDAALQQRLQQNDKALRSNAYGDVDGPPVAKRVDAPEPLPDRKGFDPYAPLPPPPEWEKIKPNGKNKGGLQTCLVM